MQKRLNLFLDLAADFIAHRKGLLPLLGIGLIIINFLFQFIPGLSWLSDINLFLHIGIIAAIVGFLLAWAL